MANKDNVFNSCFPGITYNKLTKKELNDNIKKAKKGDENSFEFILSHMYNYLIHLSREFFVQGGDDQDIYQEGAIKLINVIDKYDNSKGGFMAFAQSSIRKHIITVINREKAKKRCILNTSFSLDDSAENDEGDKISYIDTVSSKDSLVPNSFGDPLEVVRKDYELYLIEEISKNLSPMEQKVFVLRFIEGYSYKEVAKQLNLYKIKSNGKKTLDQKSVDNAIWRSRPKIKKALEKLKISPKEFKIEVKILKKRKEKRRKISQCELQSSKSPRNIRKTKPSS